MGGDDRISRKPFFWILPYYLLEKRSARLFQATLAYSGIWSLLKALKARISAGELIELNERNGMKITRITLGALTLSLAMPFAASADTVSPLSDGSGYVVGKIGTLGLSKFTLLGPTSVQTVLVTGSTLYDVDSFDGTYADLRPGMLARVTGTWNTGKKNILATKIAVGAFVQADMAFDGFLGGGLGLGGSIGLSSYPGNSSWYDPGYLPWNPWGQSSLYSANSADALSYGLNKNNAFATDFNKSFASDLNAFNINKNLFSADTAFRLKEHVEDDHLFKLSKINTVKYEVTNGINIVKQDHYLRDTDTANASSLKAAQEKASALNTSDAGTTNASLQSVNSLSAGVDKLNTDSIYKSIAY